MNRLIQRLPLQAKLLIIGLIPFCFVVYLSLEAYRQSGEKMRILENYQGFIRESGNINGLIESLQDERQYSLDFALTGERHANLLLQRPRTDAFIDRLTKSKDPSIEGFTHYTKLGELDQLRAKIDSSKTGPNEIMHYFSNCIFRMNTLNTLPPGNTAYLENVYNDLQAQKILSEMITYLSIINSNIYNVLHTRQYMVETLIGTVGTYDVLNSYKTELSHKASPQVLEEFNSVADTTALKPTLDYINKLFGTFKFDDTYDARQWLTVSEKGADDLRRLQAKVRERVSVAIAGIYERERWNRQQALIILSVAMLLMLVAVLYVTYVIGLTLKRLRIAAEKIAEGETGVDIRVESDDSIGKLAKSIAEIDRHNQAIARAAVAIGTGNFEIPLSPRGQNDSLSKSIVQMKNELSRYSRDMERRVKLRTEELKRSNDDLHQFAHVASHDLKEPLRKIATFSDILQHEQGDKLTPRGKLYLEKIELAAKRMSTMIEGVLNYSTLATEEKQFERVSLENILSDVQNDLELAIIQKGATIEYGNLPDLCGMPLLLHQLFYNLINNSLKFSRPGTPPHISIGVEPAAPPAMNEHRQDLKFVRITLRDNGIGFKQEYAEQMFAVFSRLNPKDRFEGTGLGLALCRKIVRRHHGEISAEGREGEGSCFHLTLPLA